MKKQDLVNALSKIGFSVGEGVPQVVNSKGEYLPFFVNLTSIDSAHLNGWSIRMNYDDMKIKEMLDNDNNISAINIEAINNSQTFLMFYR